MKELQKGLDDRMAVLAEIRSQVQDFDILEAAGKSAWPENLEILKKLSSAQMRRDLERHLFRFYETQLKEVVDNAKRFLGVNNDG